MARPFILRVGDRTYYDDHANDHDEYDEYEEYMEQFYNPEHAIIGRQAILEESPTCRLLQRNRV